MDPNFEIDSGEDAEDYIPIVVYSHLRWDEAERSRQVFLRFAEHRRVLFIEEPVFAAGALPTWTRETPAAGVLVLRPATAVKATGFDGAQLPILRRMLRDVLLEEDVTDHLAWLTTPMAQPLAQSASPVAGIYDATDERTDAFDVRPALVKLETDLLRWADLVFTDSPGVFRATRGRHSSVHYFPSSVDVDRFVRAHAKAEPAPGTDELPRPRLGYHGPIDGRVNLALIDAVARAHPDWSVVLLGPTSGMGPEALRQLPNVHLLGDRPDHELPAHLVAWDVGLLPLALHDPHVVSTSLPLEYMAAELPIVTTPAPDVIEAYGDIVHSGRNPEEFVEACEQALGEHEGTRVRRATRMRQVLARTSWEVTIEAMDDLVAVLERGYRPKAGAPPARVAAVNAERTPRAPVPHGPA